MLVIDQRWRLRRTRLHARRLDAQQRAWGRLAALAPAWVLVLLRAHVRCLASSPSLSAWERKKVADCVSGRGRKKRVERRDGGETVWLTFDCCSTDSTAALPLPAVCAP